jgi:translocation and assembly module TamB
MKRWLFYSTLFLLLTFFLLLSTIIGMTSWIVSTESGLRFLVAQAQRWAPGELSVQTVQGRLWDQFSLSGFSYRDKQTAVQLETLQFSWEAAALWQRQVHVKQLLLDQLTLELPAPSEEPSQPFEIPDIQLPVQLALDEVQISQVTVKRPNAEPIIIDNVELRSHTSDVLTLEHCQIQLDSPQPVNAKLAGDVGLVKPHRVQLDLNWSAQLPDLKEVVGSGQLTGDIKTLVLTHTVSKPLEVNVQAELQDVLGALIMDAVVSWEDVYWPLSPKVAKDYQFRSQQGRLTVTGQLANYSIDFTGKITGRSIPAGQWQLAAHGNQTGLSIKQLSANMLSGLIHAQGQVNWQPSLAGELTLKTDQIDLQPLWPEWPAQLVLDSELVAALAGEQVTIKQLTVELPPATPMAKKRTGQPNAQLTLQAEASWHGGEPQIKQATVNWQHLQWPLVVPVGQRAMVASQQGRINLAGTLKNYQLNLDSQITGEQIPPGHLSIRGQGNQQQFQIDNLDSQLLQGRLQGTGKVTWQPNLQARLNLNTQAISIKDFWADWPASLRINGQLLAQLRDKDFQIDRLQVQIPQTGAQLSLQGKGKLADNNPVIQQATVNWQQLQWPLLTDSKSITQHEEKSPQVTSQQGKLNFSGSLQNYQLALETQIASDSLKMPAGRWQLTGTGNLKQFTINSLKSNLLQGSLTGKGQVSWQPQLAAQVKLNVDQVTVKDFWPEWPQSLRLTSQLVGSLQNDTFKINQLTVNIPQTDAQIALQGEGNFGGELQLKNTQIRWQHLQWPLIGKALVTTPQGSVDISGNLQNYRLALTTQLATDLLPSSKWQIAGRGNLEQFTVQSLESQLLKGKLKGQGKVSWQSGIEAQVKLNAQQIDLQPFWQPWPDSLRLNSELVAQLAGEQFKVSQLTVDLPKTATTISVQGNGTLKQPVAFDTQVSWKSLHWPLVLEETWPEPENHFLVFSRQGQLKAKGTLENYQLSLLTDIKGKDIPTGQWRAMGDGDLRHFTLQSVHGDVLEGALDLTGEVGWQPQLFWQLMLEGDSINPGSQWTAWPGQLALNLSTQGELDAQGALKARLKVNQVAGQVRDYPVQLTTDLMADIPLGVTTQSKTRAKNPESTYHAQINHFQFKSGDAQLTAQGAIGAGEFGPQVDLNWRINAPDIATLLPESQGRLQGEGSLAGPVHLPHVTANLHGKNLAFQKYQLANLATDIDVNLLSKEDLHLEILANDFSQGEQNIIKTLSVKGEGRVAAHSLIASVMLPQDRLVFQLQGGLQYPKAANSIELPIGWQGKLQELTLATEKFSHWQLQQPVSLALSSTEASIAPFCLTSTQNAKLCPQVNWQAQAGSQLSVNLQALPLSLLHPFLPPKAEITGTVDATMETQLQADGALNAQTELTLSPGVLKTMIGETSEEFTHDGGSMTLQIDEKQGLVSQLKLSLLKQSHLEAGLNLPHFTHLPFDDKQSVQASANLQALPLSLLRPFLPPKTEITGTVDATMETQLQADGALNAQAELTLSPGVLKTMIGETSEEITHDGGSMNLQIDEKQGLVSQLKLSLLKQSHLEAGLNLPRFTHLPFDDKQSVQASANLQALPLSLLRPFLPPETEITGLVDATMETQLQADGALNSQVQLNLSPGIFKTMIEDTHEEMAHHGGLMTLQIDERGLVSQLKLSLLEQTRLQGNLNLPDFTHLPPGGEQPIQGTVNATFADFKILPTFVPQLENPTGQVQMEMNLGGTLTTPNLQGLLKVQKVQADLPDFGLQIKNLNMMAQAKEQAVQIQAQMNSGDGKMSLDGQVQLNSFTDWQANFTVKGQEFEVINIPAAWAVASPDLQVALVPDQVTVTGQVYIPEALLTPTGSEFGGGGVTISDDVVIVNPKEPDEKEEQTSAPKKPAMAISSQVKVILGELVSFKGFGFESNLTGSLIANTQPGQVTTGNGQITVIDGTYKSYGQDLKIDKGYVSFTGGPIENPGLDIKAYRRIERFGEDDVIAGLKMAGTAKAPSISFYSEPPMDQSNTLSYIVLGKPTAQLGTGELSEKDERALLVKAVSALPINQGDDFTNKISKGLGIDDIGLSTAGSQGVNQAALMVGKYLTPELYISYGVGLFDGQQIVRMRYELNKNFSIETETGKETGVELRYSFER